MSTTTSVTVGGAALYGGLEAVTAPEVRAVGIEGTGTVVAARDQADCPEDLDSGSPVDFADSIIMLSNWGPSG